MGYGHRSRDCPEPPDEAFPKGWGRGATSLGSGLVGFRAWFAKRFKNHVV